MINLKNQFDFRRGARIGQDVVDGWHSKVLQQLKDAEVGTTLTTSSGNSILIGRVVHYEHEEKPTIVIYEIMDGYQEYTYQNQ